MIRIEVRGLGDIKTHSTLARKGRLVSVARDLHRLGRSRTFESESRWNVGSEEFKRCPGVKKPHLDLVQSWALERIVAEEMAKVRELMSEMGGFLDEGVPGALGELQRLKAKLSRLERESKST